MKSGILKVIGCGLFFAQGGFADVTCKPVKLFKQHERTYYAKGQLCTFTIQHVGVYGIDALSSLQVVAKNGIDLAKSECQVHSLEPMRTVDRFGSTSFQVTSVGVSNNQGFGATSTITGSFVCGPDAHEAIMFHR